jgi:hypothetical protein
MHTQKIFIHASLPDQRDSRQGLKTFPFSCLYSPFCHFQILSLYRQVPPSAFTVSQAFSCLSLFTSLISLVIAHIYLRALFLSSSFSLESVSLSASRLAELPLPPDLLPPERFRGGSKRLSQLGVAWGQTWQRHSDDSFLEHSNFDSPIRRSIPFRSSVTNPAVPGRAAGDSLKRIQRRSTLARHMRGAFPSCSSSSCKPESHTTSLLFHSGRASPILLYASLQSNL